MKHVYNIICSLVALAGVALMAIEPLGGYRAVIVIASLVCLIGALTNIADNRCSPEGTSQKVLRSTAFYILALGALWHYCPIDTVQKISTGVLFALIGFYHTHIMNYYDVFGVDAFDIDEKYQRRRKYTVWAAITAAAVLLMIIC